MIRAPVTPHPTPGICRRGAAFALSLWQSGVRHVSLVLGIRPWDAYATSHIPIFIPPRHDAAYRRHRAVNMCWYMDGRMERVAGAVLPLPVFAPQPVSPCPCVYGVRRDSAMVVTHLSFKNPQQLLCGEIEVAEEGECARQSVLRQVPAGSCYRRTRSWWWCANEAMPAPSPDGYVAHVAVIRCRASRQFAAASGRCQRACAVGGRWRYSTRRREYVLSRR